MVRALAIAGLFVGAVIGLAGVLLALALLVYIYPAVPLLDPYGAIVGLAFCWMGVSVFTAPLSSDKDKWLVWGASVAFWVFLWITNGYVLYLASAWDIQPGWGSWGLLLPQRSINFVGGFLAAWVNVMFDVTLTLPDASLPNFHEVAAPASGPVVSWILDSVWNVILGVIAALLCAARWARSKA